MQSLTLVVAKLDAGHKNSNKIRAVDGSRSIEATVTAMNEYGQVVGMWHGSGGIKELVEMLRRLNARNVALGKVGQWKAWTARLNFRRVKVEGLSLYAWGVAALFRTVDSRLWLLT